MLQCRVASKRQAVDEFLRHRKIPPKLADRIRNFFGYVLEREVHADESAIISSLSSSLRNEAVMHLYREAVEKVPFFKKKHPQFIASIVTCLKLEYYAPVNTPLVLHGHHNCCHPSSEMWVSIAANLFGMCCCVVQHGYVSWPEEGQPLASGLP
jgi:hypothetical protein